MYPTLKGEFITEIPNGYDRMILFSKYLIFTSKELPPLKFNIETKKWDKIEIEEIKIEEIKIEMKLEDYVYNIDT